mgnify:CR=1 FL=1
MAFRIQIRRGTANQWTAENPILLDGELAIETDTRKFKIGNGITTWNNLPYATQGEAGKSLQYVWDGTRLGIKREGETSYTYVDLKGDEGKPGTTTWEGITDKPTEFMPIPHEHDILYYKKETVDTKLNAKVDKVANKGLSTNDYTDTEKAKNQSNADNIFALQKIRIYEGVTEPTDTRFWYDPNDTSGVVRK